MSRMSVYLAIAFFGVLGCWARYAISQFVQNAWGTAFPYATFVVNISGAFLMGFLFVATLERMTVPVAIRTGILTGFLGGYTTFSTYMMETLLLAEQGAVAKGLLYVLLSTVTGFIAAFLGVFVAHNV